MPSAENNRVQPPANSRTKYSNKSQVKPLPISRKFRVQSIIKSLTDHLTRAGNVRSQTHPNYHSTTVVRKNLLENHIYMSQRDSCGAITQLKLESNHTISESSAVDIIKYREKREFAHGATCQRVQKWLKMKTI